MRTELSEYKIVFKMCINNSYFHISVIKLVIPLDLEKHLTDSFFICDKYMIHLFKRLILTLYLLARLYYYKVNIN